MGQLLYQVCYTRYQVSIYLWWIRPVLKKCKVPKYYDQDCTFFILAEDHVKNCCHRWIIYFWKSFFIKHTAIWWSYHIPLNYIWILSFCFCYWQNNLMKSCIKIANGNGDLSEWPLFIMWSFGQHYIFLWKNARQLFLLEIFAILIIFY